MWYNNGEVEILVTDSSYNEEGFFPGRLKRQGTREKEIQNKLQEISQYDLISFYANHNAQETCEHFNLSSRKVLYSICKTLNYTKDKPTMSGALCRTHESYIDGGKKSSETQKRNWGLKTAEEKQVWSDKISLALNNSNFKNTKPSQNSAYRRSLTKEENDRQNEMRSIAMKQWWCSLTEKERQQQINLRLGNGAGYHTSNSKPNLLFKEKLEKDNIEFSREFRLGKYSYDFKIKNVLVEINPYAVHNSTWSPFGAPKDKNYHIDKTQSAVANGYRCIHVWDWDDTDKILSLLKIRQVLYARDCNVVEVSKADADKYLSEYHLQGYAKDTIRIGLMHNDKLVSLMTFGKPRYNKAFQWELIRFCSNYYINGGAEKLFSYFITRYTPDSIISYCDNSKFTGDIYNKLGFTLDSKGKPSKHWFNPQTKSHITDNLLRARGYDQLFNTSFGKGTSNRELMILAGYVEIYDCGQSRYIWGDKIKNI